MKVVYLTEIHFEQACADLCKVVESAFLPDLIIGVLTGGGVVAKSFMASSSLNTPYIEIKIRRNLTKKKEKLNVTRVLRVLPRPITELLINLEVWYLEKMKSKSNTKRIIGEEDREKLRKTLMGTQLKNILVIDDCIDTGNTIKVLVDYLFQNDPSLNVKIAAITTTHKEPVIKADYSLYDRTICRFPWSMEIKKS